VNGADAALTRGAAARLLEPVDRFKRPRGLARGPDRGRAPARIRCDGRLHRSRRVRLALAGEHNRCNALPRCRRFGGRGRAGPRDRGTGHVRRRAAPLEVAGEAFGVTVYDDFAHTIRAQSRDAAGDCGGAWTRRRPPPLALWAVFEPRSKHDAPGLDAAAAWSTACGWPTGCSAMRRARGGRAEAMQIKDHPPLPTPAARRGAPIGPGSGAASRRHVSDARGRFGHCREQARS